MPLNKKCLLKSKTESQPSTFQLPYCGLFSLIYLLHTAPCARLAASNVKSTTIDLLGKIPAKWQGGFSLIGPSKSHADQGCISCGILVSEIRARGVSSEHMENMEMFSCSPT